MGVPTSEVGYTSATTGRGDHEVHKGHVVGLAQKYLKACFKELNKGFEKEAAYPAANLCHGPQDRNKIHRHHKLCKSCNTLASSS
jgi:hypothetical protein